MSYTCSDATRATQAATRAGSTQSGTKHRGLGHGRPRRDIVAVPVGTGHGSAPAASLPT